MVLASKERNLAIEVKKLTKQLTHIRLEQEIVERELQLAREYLEDDDIATEAVKVKELLLTEIKVLCSKMLGTNSLMMSLMRITCTTSSQDLSSTIEYHSSEIFFDRDLVKSEIRSDNIEDLSTITGDEYRQSVTDKSKAVAFLNSANKKTYGKLLVSIREQYSSKMDVYPKSLVDAYEMLSANTLHGVKTSEE